MTCLNDVARLSTRYFDRDFRIGGDVSPSGGISSYGSRVRPWVPINAESRSSLNKKFEVTWTRFILEAGS